MADGCGGGHVSYRNREGDRLDARMGITMLAAQSEQKLDEARTALDDA